MSALAVFRAVHILSGVIWVGSASFITLFLEPALSRLDGSTRGRVWAGMRARGFHIGLLLANLLVIISGVGLFGWMTGFANLGGLLHQGWGIAIVGGGTCAVASTVLVNAVLEPRLRRLSQPGGLHPDQIARLAAQAAALARTNLILLWTATISMALARFV